MSLNQCVTYLPNMTPTPENTPPNTPNCDTIKAQLQTVETLNQAFQTLTQQTPRDIPAIRAQKEKLEKEMAALEALLIPQELLEQYHSQHEALRTLGLLTTLPDGTEGIEAFNGTSYRMPSIQELIQSVAQNRERITQKLETLENPTLHITPVGISIPTLLHLYATTLKQQQHHLKHSTGTPASTTDWNNTFDYENAADTPLYAWDAYKEADAQMRYLDPATDTTYSQTAGITKEQFVTKHRGFTIQLIEDVPDIPATGTGTADRKTPPASTTPNTILETLHQASQDPAHPLHGEQGLTLEQYLWYAIQKAAQGIVIDDYDTNQGGTGKVSWIAGNFLSGGVPCGYWYRNDRQASVGGRNPGNVSGGIAVRLGVGVEKA